MIAFAIIIRGFLKIRFFEADKILKPKFTAVNEDFKIEVQQRKKQFLEDPITIKYVISLFLAYPVKKSCRCPAK